MAEKKLRQKKGSGLFVDNIPFEKLVEGFLKVPQHLKKRRVKKIKDKDESLDQDKKEQ